MKVIRQCRVVAIATSELPTPARPAVHWRANARTMLGELHGGGGYAR